jgi:hypothetical protein
LNNFIKKIIVAKEVFEHCYKFNPINQVKVSYIKLSLAGAAIGFARSVELEPEPKEIISAPQTA